MEEEMFVNKTKKWTENNMSEIIIWENLAQEVLIGTISNLAFGNVDII